ncbi:ABC transporter permease [Streptomyces sp. SM11]|uniref:ABC transporter permease n=1 Tax=Streptomyces sp. SM11 TaxID=565557 RepID=UPI000CD4E8BC|nr:ABC transporter permease [Streptomyces sp. SM11]
MLAYLRRRLLSGLVLLMAVTSLSFLLLYAGSGDVVRRILGGGATQEQIAAKSAELGLDEPVWTQFANWASGALHGDLGRSWFTGETVAEGIGNRLPVTLSLVLGTTLLTVVLSAVLGVWAATRGGTVDRIVQGMSVIGIALPGFVVALLLVTVFAVQLKLFAATGYTPLGDSPTQWLRAVTLPVIALALSSTVNLTQQIRGAVLDTLRQDWVRTLRTRGLPARRILFRHVLRNAAGAALTVLSLQTIGLLGGAVIIEQIFALPGIGQYAITATGGGDLPTIMGLVVMTTVMVVIINLLTDLAQGWLTPKARQI